MSHGQLKLFSGSAHPALAREIADQLDIPLGSARLHRFPDTEVSFQIDENIRGTDVFVVQPTSAPVDEHLVELCVMIDAFRRSSASRITAIPYYGYARQDRKDKPRVPISAQAGRESDHRGRREPRADHGSARRRSGSSISRSTICSPRRSSSSICCGRTTGRLRSCRRTPAAAGAGLRQAPGRRAGDHQTARGWHGGSDECGWRRGSGLCDRR